MFHRPGEVKDQLIGKCNKKCNGKITTANYNHSVEIIKSSIVLSNFGIKDSGLYKISVLYQGVTEIYIEELNVTVIEHPDTSDHGQNHRIQNHTGTGIEVGIMIVVPIITTVIIIALILGIPYLLKKRKKGIRRNRRDNSMELKEEQQRTEQKPLKEDDQSEV
ncbi:hypothetical protein XELAEV_18040468mg [Xenopus laevis]|uniref:Uncharacterized protein n=1 Tax=Xenopus laevis TaxID=8355 RepID=A0A974C9N7_XENLA|nr:hypothetical protein XELAEV_18040468mg [Xenopus laevis]